MTWGESSRFSLVSRRRPQTRARCRLKQQRTSVCLFLALAPQFNRILGFNLNGAERLLDDQTDHRAQEEVRTDDECSGKYGRGELTRSGEGSDHC